MADIERRTVWEWLREYAATQSGSFTSQEAVSWFRRHAPAKANDQTVRSHLRGACWNVGDRSQFSHREPFLTRLDRGVFRSATSEEIGQWRAQQQLGVSAEPSPVVERDRAGLAAPPQAGNALSSATAMPLEQAWDRSEGWHTEANVQAILVTALATHGWRVLSVANTATKERGVDVIAVRDARTVGIEVKGFPSRGYADPARAGEVKRTRPSTQAGHWYAEALLAAMRLRGKEPTWTSVIALPDFPRYRDLHAETAAALAATRIEVWWVDQTGTVEWP